MDYDRYGRQFFERGAGVGRGPPRKLLLVVPFFSFGLVRIVSTDWDIKPSIRVLTLTFSLSKNSLEAKFKIVTVFLVSSNNWVTSVAPLENFQNRENNLDTIGVINKKVECERKEL